MRDRLHAAADRQTPSLVRHDLPQLTGSEVRMMLDAFGQRYRE